MQIKNKDTDDTMFEFECDSMISCVEAAVKAGVDLTGANLTNADLRGANL